MFFNKDKKRSKIETIIGAGTELEGNIHTNESVRIDGKVRGEIRADCVIIGEQGSILGNVSANEVSVGGRVKGDISSSTLLDLHPSGQILGDIRTSKLIVADGATFEGNCQMVKTDGQVIEMNEDNASAQNNHQNGKNLKVLNTKK